MDLQYRSSLRGQLTRVVNATNEYLNGLAASDGEKLADLSTLLQRLGNVHGLLMEADTTVRPLIEEKNYQVECNTVLEYNDKAVTAIARVQHKISVLQVPPVLQASNSRTREQPNQRGPHNLQSQAIKLPRLELKKFNDDHNNWLPFWEQYKTAVHLNAALDDCTKFNFLQSCLTGRAADTIAGLTLQ